MEYSNSVYPNEEQMKGFADSGPDGPIYMLNLLKFKEKAEYADGRETDLTGEQASRSTAKPSPSSLSNSAALRCSARRWSV